MEQAVVGGLGIIQAYIAPELIITQAETLEDSFFLKGIQVQKRETGITHIALPAASSDLMWIASLDSTALRGKSTQHPKQYGVVSLILMRSMKSLE